MKKTTTRTRLKLVRETIRQLTSQQLRRAGGGIGTGDCQDTWLAGCAGTTGKCLAASAAERE
jgi:hypothetical protein